MISTRRQSANRLNAAKSTGPRTLSGKARSSQNARRHGLAAAASSEAPASEEIQGLAQALAGAWSQDPGVLALAVEVAEAQGDLRRVRLLKAERLDQWLKAAARHRVEFPRPYVSVRTGSLEAQWRAAQALLACRIDDEGTDGDRSRRLKAWYRALTVTLKTSKMVTGLLDRVDRRSRRDKAELVSQFEREWLCLDRYERRALGRRKKALRALAGALRISVQNQRV